MNRVVYHVAALFADLQIAILLTLTPLIASLMFALMRPYKNNFYNAFDSLFFLYLAVFHVFITYDMYVAPLPITSLAFPLSLASMGYFIVITTYSILVSCAPNYLESMKEKIKENINRIFFCNNDNVRGDADNRLIVDENDDGGTESDRVRNPEQYQHLIRSCDNRVELANTNNYGTLTG